MRVPATSPASSFRRRRWRPRIGPPLWQERSKTLPCHVRPRLSEALWQMAHPRCAKKSTSGASRSSCYGSQRADNEKAQRAMLRQLERLEKGHKAKAIFPEIVLGHLFMKKWLDEGPAHHGSAGYRRQLLRIVGVRPTSGSSSKPTGCRLGGRCWKRDDE